MTKQSVVTADLGQLDTLLKKLGGEFVTKVGFIGAKGAENHPDTELTNAEIAFIHEFGSFSQSIPARSMLRFPLEAKQKELVSEMTKGTAREAFKEGNIEKFYKILGVAAQAIVQEAFATGGFGQWKANAPSTVAKKGSSAPLIDTGVLRRSVSSEVVKRSEL